MRGRNAFYIDRAVTSSHLDEAVGHLSAAINLEPAYWDAHSQLGYALYLRGRYSDAADVLQVAVANDRSDRHLRRLLASILGDQCRFDEARAVFSDAYKESLNVEALDVLADWGRALEGFGFRQAALDQETQVIDRDPGHVSARVFRGTMRIRNAVDDKKRIDEAVTDFEAAFKADAARSDFMMESYLLGLLHAKRYQQAVERYKEWAANGLVPSPENALPDPLPAPTPNQRLRLLFDDAVAHLQANAPIDEGRQRELYRPIAGGTVGDEDKSAPRSCRMGSWRQSLQLSDVAIPIT